MAPAESGGWMAARMRMEPPQSGHSRASMANTRRRKSAQGWRRGERGSGAAAGCRSGSRKAFEAFGGERGAGEVAAQALEAAAVGRRNGGTGVQGESGGSGAEGDRRLGAVVGIDAIAAARGLVAVAVEAADRRGGKSGETGKVRKEGGQPSHRRPPGAARHTTGDSAHVPYPNIYAGVTARAIDSFPRAGERLSGAGRQRAERVPGVGDEARFSVTLRDAVVEAASHVVVAIVHRGIRSGIHSGGIEKVPETGGA